MSNLIIFKEMWKKLVTIKNRVKIFNKNPADLIFKGLNLISNFNLYCFTNEKMWYLNRVHKVIKSGEFERLESDF